MDRKILKKIKYHLISITSIFVLLFGCIEPISIIPESFEELMVVEATITNEVKFQVVKISRTFDTSLAKSAPESNAKVTIIDSEGKIYLFNEDLPGTYTSETEFAAFKNNSYSLFIITSDGKEYRSSAESLPSTSLVENINFSRELDDNGNLGVAVYINSFDPTGNSRYYRYEYEQTYKIIAPFWSRSDLIAVSDTEVELVPRTTENRVCYKTELSTSITQTETTGLSEDRVTQKLVKFLKVDDFAISYRYSILVNQLVQSPEAYNYYNTLNKLSINQNLLSQNQPGFITGNISSLDNSNEKVIGFFDVSTVSSVRGFFNFRDFFSSATQPRPPYIVDDCTLIAPRVDDNNKALIEVIEKGEYIYTRPNYVMGDPPVIPNGGPYVMVIRECGDCTLIGSNVAPDFWEE